MKLNIQKDRIKIAEIIEKNIKLLRKNPKMSQDVADAIILYLIEKK